MQKKMRIKVFRVVVEKVANGYYVVIQNISTWNKGFQCHAIKNDKTWHVSIMVLPTLTT